MRWWRRDGMTAKRRHESDMMATASSFTRRHLLLAALAAGPMAAWALPERRLEFPRDFGSHPDLHTEWWYVTGHAKTRPGVRSVSR
jgi:predicted secreted hydrolase